MVTPFSTNALAQAAALAALKADDEMRRRAELVVRERDRVVHAMRELVPSVPDSQANFVWLPIEDRSMPFAKHCESHGVIVRPFPQGVRVSFGTPEQNDRFIEVAKAFLA